MVFRKKPVPPEVKRSKLMQRVSIDDETGCWNWNGTLNKDGYGKYGHQRTQTHRVAYECFVGPIPEGLCVMHKCDNRRCINPDHLKAATHQENMADMFAKKRAKLDGLRRGRQW